MNQEMLNKIEIYLWERIKQMRRRKPKSYTNKIRKHECEYLLKKINEWKKNYEENNE